MLSLAASASEHEHVFGEWTPGENNMHTALCEECGEELSARHYTFTSKMGEASVSVCAACGQYQDGVLALIEGAQALSEKPTPSKQKGVFIARGLESPFAGDETIIYAFTAAYINNGELATWKDVSTVSLPLNIELPEDYQLVRVTPSAGDDSVQNPEKRTEMESSYEDGVLCFSTKTPALYLITGGEK